MHLVSCGYDTLYTSLHIFTQQRLIKRSPLSPLWDPPWSGEAASASLPSPLGDLANAWASKNLRTLQDLAGPTLEQSDKHTLLEIATCSCNWRSAQKSPKLGQKPADGLASVSASGCGCHLEKRQSLSPSIDFLRSLTVSWGKDPRRTCSTASSPTFQNQFHLSTQWFNASEFWSPKIYRQH